MPEITRFARLLPVAAVLAACGGNDAIGDRSLVRRVERGSLFITVRERGELQAAQDTRVASLLEGRATLIHLIREGSVVKTGDVLARLDSSAIEEKRANQAIAVAKAEAAFEQARKNFEIMEQELLAAERTAQSRLTIAEMRLEKFIGQPRDGASAALDSPVEAEPAADTSDTNAEMIHRLRQLVVEEKERDPLAETRYADLDDKLIELLGGEANLGHGMGETANQVLQLIDEVGLARADLKLAEDTLTYSRKLAAREFITRNELERDVINHRRQTSRMTVAWNNLQVLVNYTLAENRITLLQEIDNARLGLASVRASGEARRVREAAELKSSELEFDLAKERLQNYDQQIANAVMKAPSPGLVVYGRFDWDEPVHEGMEIRERQEVVILPDISTMLAEIKVHEAQIDKVAVGQSATVRVDAFPERSFSARVLRVSTLPDPGPRSQDVKVYRAAVQIDADNRDGSLRPGMNATVEIAVGRVDAVLSLPLTAVKRRGDTYYVFAAEPGGPLARRVELGVSNLTHVEIARGLGDGDEVWLVPPPGSVLPAESPREPGAAEPALLRIDGAAAEGAGAAGR
ncbi:MAG TPA: efflux RND transporter periplasmic adaptor subunit [Planctomycetota bacterium]|nr:efflux RND transporter periplasmic adaptor subunit [Planctomycetota bacterium]